MKLKNLTNNKVYEVTSGKLLSPHKAKSLDVTASMLDILDPETNETLMLLYAYDKEGNPVDKNWEPFFDSAAETVIDVQKENT